jgi:hypothetical protein
MRNMMKYSIIQGLVIIMSLGSIMYAEDLSELKHYLRKSVSWRSTTHNKVVPLNIYFLGGDAGPDGSEVIVYIQNSFWDRIGQESDLSILSDYIQKRFIVITIDFGKDKMAVSPQFDKDLHEIFKAVYGYKTESLLKNLNLEGSKEVGRFKGFPEGSPEPQPWPGYPSNISVGYQSMGIGLFEPEYITHDYVPTIVACGENERDLISKEAHPAFVKRLEELDVNYINLFMQGLGHEVPYGFDERMGVDRYQLVHDFFDRYLKVEEKLPPVVLVISPRDNKEEVSPDTEISIDLAPVIDSQNIIRDKGIMIVQTNNNKEVEGIWNVSHGGTKYTFIPANALNKNEHYSIIVTTKVKDKAGKHLDKEKIVHFRVASEV